MDSRYDIFELISQREDNEMPEENEDLVSVALAISRATSNGGKDEGQSEDGPVNVIHQNEKEKRASEEWAKEHGCWIPITDLMSIGIPGPCGSEADTYLSNDGYVYKVNNLMHCYDSIVQALVKFIRYNILFPDTAYKFIGFTGFGGRSVMPVVRQRFIKGCVPATQNEIDCYMAALGFEKQDRGTYVNREYVVSDVLPKNVLKDNTGDCFVIDVEIRQSQNHVDETLS